MYIFLYQRTFPHYLLPLATFQKIYEFFDGKILRILKQKINSLRFEHLLRNWTFFHQGDFVSSEINGNPKEQGLKSTGDVTLFPSLLLAIFGKWWKTCVDWYYLDATEHWTSWPVLSVFVAGRALNGRAGGFVHSQYLKTNHTFNILPNTEQCLGCSWALGACTAWSPGSSHW